MMDLRKPKNQSKHPSKSSENGVGIGKDKNQHIKRSNITTTDLKKEKYTKITEKDQGSRESPVKSKSSPYLSPSKTPKSPYRSPQKAMVKSRLELSRSKKSGADASPDKRVDISLEEGMLSLVSSEPVVQMVPGAGGKLDTATYDEIMDFEAHFLAVDLSAVNAKFNDFQPLSAASYVDPEPFNLRLIGRSFLNYRIHTRAVLQELDKSQRALTATVQRESSPNVALSVSESAGATPHARRDAILQSCASEEVLHRTLSNSGLRRIASRPHTEGRGARGGPTTDNKTSLASYAERVIDEQPADEDDASTA